METTVVVLYALSILFASLGPALTLFVAYRFGLVGGSPRELLSLQMESARADRDLAVQKLKLEEELAALRARQLEVALQRKEQALINPPPPPQRHVMNPMGGTRTAMPIPPPPTRPPQNGTGR